MPLTYRLTPELTGHSELPSSLIVGRTKWISFIDSGQILDPNQHNVCCDQSVLWTTEKGAPPPKIIKYRLIKN